MQDYFCKYEHWNLWVMNNNNDGKNKKKYKHNYDKKKSHQ